MSLRVLCPNGHLLEVPQQYVGAVVRCPICSVQMMVAAVAMPVPTTPPAPPPPPSPAPPPAAPPQFLSLPVPELPPPAPPPPSLELGDVSKLTGNDPWPDPLPRTAQPAPPPAPPRLDLNKVPDFELTLPVPAPPPPALEGAELVDDHNIEVVEEKVDEIEEIEEIEEVEEPPILAEATEALLTAIVATPVPPNQAPVAQLIMTPELVEEEPPRRARAIAAAKYEKRLEKEGMTASAQMEYVLLGLGLHYAKTLCLAAAVLFTEVMYNLLIFGSMKATAEIAGGSNEGVKTAQASAFFAICISCVNFLLVFAGVILGGVGSILCCQVPKRSRTRPLIIVSIGLEVFALLGLLLASVLALSESTRIAALVIFILCLLATLAGWVLFMLFLRAMGYYLKDEVTGDEAMKILLMQMALMLTSFMVIFMLVYNASGNLASIAFLLVVVTLAFIGINLKILVALLNVIGTVRQLIASRF